MAQIVSHRPVRVGVDNGSPQSGPTTKALLPKTVGSGPGRLDHRSRPADTLGQKFGRILSPT
ncbi:hypothetical protein [Kitasatospora sp. MAP5-34]|uniref:hypothetical protein n=1 Tax=Kitasatospora sp. MAP5-34 TaxID=3035102 RepID=UPI002476D385|nr:hypothetical protein [Kitasatospora sp. MAP5-34]MDH6578755.1 hypothetical protein [Kitasatospora sp. MAP5-34]